MPIFEYQATDNNGRVVRGTVYGTSPEAASQELISKGYAVTHIDGDTLERRPMFTPLAESEIPLNTATAPGPRSYIATSVVGPVAGKVSLTQQTFFFRQAAAMFAAGVNPAETFETLAGQTSSPKFKKVITELRDQALEGRPMSFGMQRYPEVFSPLVLSIIRAGEEGGFVEGAMHQIADYLDREIALTNLKRKLTFYPKLTVVMSVVIFGGANIFIKSQAPSSSISLWNPLSQPSTWVWLGPLIIAIFLFLRVGLANARIKYNWDLAGVLVPFVGNTIHQLAMARFGRAFGALYKAGVPIQKGFTLAADACGNEYLRAKMYPAFRGLENGATIAETLDATRAFSPIVMNMIKTGEKSGNLDGMLTKMAEYYEGEAEVRATQASHVFAVVMLMVVAIFVLYLLLVNYGRIMDGRMKGADLTDAPAEVLQMVLGLVNMSSITAFIGR